MKRIKLLFAATAIFLMSGVIFAQDTTLTGTSGGNGGIGTTKPQEKLHVAGRYITTLVAITPLPVVSRHPVQRLLLLQLE